MSRSGLPSKVFLEFVDIETQLPRVVGTDSIFYVDGRWSRDTAAMKAFERAENIRKHKPSLALAGYSVSGYSEASMKVRSF